MFDFHCHILPGIDDGASSWEETLAMAAMAAEGGVKNILATPHASPQLTPEAVRQLTGELNQRLLDKGLGLVVLPGMEAYMDPDLPGKVFKGEITCIAGKYVLVELPFNSLPMYTDDIIFQLELAGYSVILAHPERNAAVIKNPGLVYEWVSKGVLIQINTGSILGKFGPDVKQTAEVLVRAGLAHFLGSDAHSDRSRRPNLAEAVPVLREWTSRARQIYSENAHMLLLGNVPELDFTQPVMPKQSWWKRLLG